MNTTHGSQTRTRAFPAGTILFREGEAGGEMFVIVSGRIRVTRTVRGVEKVLTTLPAGEFFGEMSLLNNRPRSASASVAEDAELIVVGPADFDALIHHDRQVAVRLVRRLARRLEEANRDISILMYRDARSRVAYALRRFLRDELDAETLARRVGLRTEELEVELDALRARGILTEQGVSVRDPERLERYIEYLELHHEFA